MPGSDNQRSVRKALVIRYGAIGDAIMITPVLRLLKQDGYHVTLHCQDYGKDVYDNNPYIDEFMVHVRGSVPIEKLRAYWDQLGVGYDRVVNLSGVIEEGLLKAPWQEEYTWSKEKRHALCNHNYYDATTAAAGYPEAKGEQGELFFSQQERSWALEQIRRMNNKFVILWSLSGSSFHKVYHKADEVAVRFLENHPNECKIVTIGDDLCRLLEWDHPDTKKRAGIWGVRKSLVMANYANLVVGTETGFLVAAGTSSVPKIILLSHASEENLTKYWLNCIPLHSSAECHPCHKLHYSLDTCPLVQISDDQLEVYNDNKGMKFITRNEYPACMALMKPDDLYNAIESFYVKWRATKCRFQQPQLQPQ